MTAKLEAQCHARIAHLLTLACGGANMFDQLLGVDALKVGALVIVDTKRRFMGERRDWIELLRREKKQ